MKPYFERAKTTSNYWQHLSFDYYCSAMILNESRTYATTLIPDIFNHLAEASGFGEAFEISIRLQNPFIFNAALSIELLLKSCYIESTFFMELLKKINEISQVSYDEIDFEINKIFNHNLLSLVKEVNSIDLSLQLNLDENEKIILGLFSDALVWSAKYPIPKDKETLDRHLKNLDATMTTDHTKLAFKVKIRERDLSFPNYKSLYEKINKFYIDCSH